MDAAALAEAGKKAAATRGRGRGRGRGGWGVLLTWNHSVSTCSLPITFSIEAKSVATTMSLMP